MSYNLTHFSNYVTLLRMYPLHCLCCVVEAVFLSPFSLHARNCETLPILLVILVVLVFFSIVTSIVVSFLLNVVSSIRFPTRIRSRLDLFSSFTLSPRLINRWTRTKFVFRLAINNKLTNIPPKKKKKHWITVTHLLWDTWGLFGKKA